MPLSIDQLLQEADAVIEKAAAPKKTPEYNFSSEDEAIKLANFLMEEDEALAMEMGHKPTQSRATEKVASQSVSQEQVDSGAMTAQDVLLEKVAESFAIVQTLANLEELAKMAEFEKRARDAGHSEDEINEFVEKIASKKKLITVPGALLAAGLGSAGAAGSYVGGKKKGKKEGYGEALTDVEQAFRQYNQV